mmetsp:Transcript_17447/g.49929  ORF Transcript_17447/g.49929 Transcript_17447/m.49929 type:complete len:216 (-) Transcript_17447:313-960(-)
MAAAAVSNDGGFTPAAAISNGGGFIPASATSKGGGGASSAFLAAAVAIPPDSLAIISAWASSALFCRSAAAASSFTCSLVLVNSASDALLAASAALAFSWAAMIRASRAFLPTGALAAAAAGAGAAAGVGAGAGTSATTGVVAPPRPSRRFSRASTASSGLDGRGCASVLVAADSSFAGADVEDTAGGAAVSSSEEGRGRSMVAIVARCPSIYAN